jgi:hypothetical protein
VREAKAEWIARHDADDISLADRFALQLADAETSAGLVLLGTNAVLTDEEGNPVLTTEYPRDDASLRKILFSGFGRGPHGFYHRHYAFRKFDMARNRPGEEYPGEKAPQA